MAYRFFPTSEVLVLSRKLHGSTVGMEPPLVVVMALRSPVSHNLFRCPWLVEAWPGVSMENH